MKTGNIITGIILILLGGLFLLLNLDLIDISLNLANHWPIFLLIPGLIFEFSYFINRKEPGVLVPGGILLTYGVLFYINIYYGWGMMTYLWPVFPLGVAFGLFQLYLFGGRDKALLVPVFILGGVFLITLNFNLRFLDFSFIFPILLIIVGLLIIFRRK